MERRKRGSRHKFVQKWDEKTWWCVRATSEDLLVIWKACRSLQLESRNIHTCSLSYPMVPCQCTDHKIFHFDYHGRRIRLQHLVCLMHVYFILSHASSPLIFKCSEFIWLLVVANNNKYNFLEVYFLFFKKNNNKIELKFTS